MLHAQGTHPITGALSQGDHPIFGLPYFYLHPCETASLMEMLAVGSEVSLENYISAWLSAVGPAAGCRLAAEWA